MIERNLVPLVLLAATAGLAVPSLGVWLSGAVTPLLALLMLAVSLTFDVATLRTVLRRPGAQLLATLLVYGPMSLMAFVLAGLWFGSGPLWLGVILLGVLPTDVSSPLLVWMARGNVALATVFNAVNTVLAPLAVPALLLLYTGIDIAVSLASLSLELTATVVVPTVVGVAVRTWQGERIRRVEPALSATGSLAYLALLLAVVGSNAAGILGEPRTVLAVGAVAVLLNLTGYLIAIGTWPVLASREDRVAMLFTVSKKEFSIAGFVVFASGLPARVALPAALYAVVQMLTSPAIARVLARRA